MPSILSFRLRRRVLLAGALVGLASAATFSGTGFVAAQEQAGQTVTIQTARGEKSVPEKPETVAVYDLASIDTLNALGVEIDGVPTAPYPERLSQYGESGPAKIGTLFEPDLEAINALQPDLIITGGRSAAQTDALSPLAPTIDMTVDPENYLESAIERARALAAIFDKTEATEALIAKLETSIEELRSEAETAGKGLLVLTTGNKMSAYGPGSRFGVLHTGFGVEPADTDLATGNHGEAISFEYVAETNPDWLFVLDRDAAIGRGAAASMLDNDLVRGTKAWSKGQVVYLEPSDWYLAGSSLPALQNSVDQISKAFAEKGS